MNVAPYRRPYWNTQPEYLFPKYASTVKRAPLQPLVVLPHTLSEVTAPVFGYDDVKPGDSDLTKQAKGAQIVRYEDDATMAVAVASGQADILATARSLLPAISKKNPARTAESRITMQTFYLAIGMRKDEPRLKEWVNGWVKRNLQNGRLGAIYKKYHGVDIPVEQLLKAGN